MPYRMDLIDLRKHRSTREDDTSSVIFKLAPFVFWESESGRGTSGVFRNLIHIHTSSREVGVEEKVY